MRINISIVGSKGNGYKASMTKSIDSLTIRTTNVFNDAKRYEKMSDANQRLVNLCEATDWIGQQVKEFLNELQDGVY